MGFPCDAAPRVRCRVWNCRAQVVVATTSGFAPGERAAWDAVRRGFSTPLSEKQLPNMLVGVV